MNLYNIDVLMEEFGSLSAALFKKAGVEMPLLGAIGSEETEPLQILAAAGTPAAVIRTPVYGKNASLILAVPSLVQGLDQRKTMARAIIAHELGHAYYRHPEKGLETVLLPTGARVIADVSAEMEADAFAKEIGLGEELKKFLLCYLDGMRETEIQEKEKVLKNLERRIAALSD